MDSLPLRIPDALLPLLVGAGLWFGFCLVYVAPELTKRAIDIHQLATECQSGASAELCSCAVVDVTTGSGVMKSATFIATFGLLDPRISLFDGQRNPIVEWTSLEINDRQRRDDCRDQLPVDAGALTTTAEAERRARIDAQNAFLQQLQADSEQFEAELNEIQAESQEVLEAATAAAADALNAAENCSFGDSALVGDAERLCQINQNKTEEALSWTELLLAKSKQMREQFSRQWGI